MLKRLASLIASVKPSSASTSAPPAAGNDETPGEFQSTYDAIVAAGEATHGYFRVGFGKNEAYQQMRKSWSRAKKRDFIVWLVDQCKREFKVLGHSYRYGRNAHYLTVADALASTKLYDSPETILTIGRLFLDNRDLRHNRLLNWPVRKFIKYLEQHYAKELVPEPEVGALIREYSECLVDEPALVRRLGALVGEKDAVPAFTFVTGGDHFGQPMNILVQLHFPGTAFYPLLHHANTAKAGKPSKKWTTTTAQLMDSLDEDKAVAFFAAFLDLLLMTPTYEKPRHWYDQFVLLQHDNAVTVKGLLWMVSAFDREELSRRIAKVAVAAYKKVPNKGPLDTKTGNACVTTLAMTEGLHGISQLAGLSYRIKQTGIRKRVNTILEEVAAEKNVSRQEIEDLSVLEFGLEGDVLREIIGEFTAEIQLTRPGRSTLLWRKEGKVQKSVPKSVKEGFSAELKALKARKKALQTDSINLRDRIDWGLRLNRQMTVAYFEETWQKNSLLRYFADRLIWNFSDEKRTKTIAVIRGAYGWENAEGEQTDLSKFTHLHPWHPALSTVREVQQWRTYLEEREITQPLKQAFREVYLLTAAEENTRTYSNRMAAHILKQHQFANLARGRGWSYALIGAYDHGMSTQACYQEITELGIRAEYIIQEIQDGDNFNETGIWNYVGTDQIRFLDLTRHREQLELAVIPPVLFSEVLRDTDLFTGVASIGNDDQWADGGEEVFRNYYHSYVDRDLSGLGRNRKLALERLIPRLKIRDVATVDDKYVRVTGKVRKYKIHIGSGNILMEPNDQYLCIVPAVYAAHNSSADKLYLPFEGDRTLSIILSKALLLAADDEITDRTILTQIRW